ncbi:MAG: hypothetical protein JXB42_03470, partial [Deltaproteobacteria bacterium]|nr:hypothetical protein [Deltaproteobacteria bacterium]
DRGSSQICQFVKEQRCYQSNLNPKVELITYYSMMVVSKERFYEKSAPLFVDMPGIKAILEGVKANQSTTP